MNYKLTPMGLNLQKIWEQKWAKKLTSMGLKWGDADTGIIDTKEYIKTITDECGWLLVTYGFDALNVVTEWANELGWLNELNGGFPLIEIAHELATKYLEEDN